MKRLAFIMAVILIMSFSTFVRADDFELIGREISPGIDLGDKTAGALFVGKFFDRGYSAEQGRFTLILDHDGEGIEVCGGETGRIRFKLIMNFDSGAGLVLLGPSDGAASAFWDWNDPACEDGDCPLVDGADYFHYIVLFSPAPPDPIACTAGGSAFISEVPVFQVQRQRLGSYGTRLNGGLISGHLVHTPIISPAIFGSLSLNE